jgi:hypothetical protein
LIPDFCKGTIAGFKVPKNITFIKEEAMPKTPTGKILHRVLREKYGMGSPFYFCVAMQTVEKEITFLYALGTELRLLARSIFVIDKSDVVRYVQIVPEMTKEPDYDKALGEAKKLAG